MSELRKLIDQITEFGINQKVELTDKADVLKKLLVGIYYEFLKTEFEFDGTDYEDEPDFGWYSSVLDSNKMEPNVEIGVGDELDDLTDIIKDLLAVKWRMKNKSKNDAFLQFEFLMRTHSEQHLVDLLKRLKEKNE